MTQPEQPWRPDAPKVGLFANFRDAVAEASFRAAITQRRYRVVYEPNNCWWQITEGFRLEGPAMHTDPGGSHE